MLLGNQCDLSDSWAVTKERGQLLANEHGFKFMETSAKTGFNIEEVSVLYTTFLHGVIINCFTQAFLTLARDIYAKIKDVRVL